MPQEHVQLGQLLKEPANRDAIHIAIAPVVAAHKLQPGEHIGFVSADMVGKSRQPIGIVDPFLTKAVQPGEWFYMLLYPYTITSLRHEWVHPAFPAQQAVPTQTDDVRAARAFLDRFARDWRTSVDALIEQAQIPGGYLSAGTGIYSWSEVDPDDRQEFWRALEIITGRRFSEEHRESTSWSCAC
jgi:hypothetical protein